MRWLYELLKKKYERPASVGSTDYVQMHYNHIVDGIVRLIQFDAANWQEYKSYGRHQITHKSGITLNIREISSQYGALYVTLSDVPQVKLNKNSYGDDAPTSWELDLLPDQTKRIHQAILRWEADRALSATQVLNKAFDQVLIDDKMGAST